METKTYFASSVQAAMDIARRELGPDAMLVKSGPAPEEARAFARLEVTFAWEPSAAPATADRAIYSSVSSGRRWGETQPVHTGLEDLLLEISALRAAIGGNGETGRPSRSDAVPNADPQIVEALCEQGFEKDMARQLASAAANRSSRAREGILRELTERLPTAPFSAIQPDETRTLAFVGPPGRGKTTSLIKIALRYGLAKRIPTRIYTAGVHGVGSAEQMARFAAVLGVPFQAVESYQSLSLALQGERWKGLVLIDTPGQALSDSHELEFMVQFFGRRNDIEKHLVIRAEARSADMQYMLSRFSAIQPSHLLFTGIDEARALGAAAETMIRSGIPATFFGTGPHLPEDLEEVSVLKLARSLWAPSELAAMAA